MSDRGRVLLASLGLAATTACGGNEKVVVDKYFGAVNQKDNQTLSSFAAVPFDKKVDKWEITAAQPESSVSAPLPDLVKKMREIETGIADNQRAYKAYHIDRQAQVDEARELLRQQAKIPARLQAVATEWEKFTQKDKDLKKALAEAKTAVDKERRQVLLSVGPDVQSVESLAGKLVTKQVELQLTIGGKPQPYMMTLKKYDLEAVQGPRVISRWVVTGLTPKG